jgi:hypothetical protein
MTNTIRMMTTPTIDDDNGKNNTKNRRSRGGIMPETGLNNEQLVVWVPR